MAAQIRQVLQHGPMDKASASAPAVRGQRVRDHRYVTQLRHFSQFRADPVVQVQVLWAPATPVQGGRACDVLLLHVLDDGLDRGKAGARGQQHHRLVAVLAQVKAAKRTLQAQDFFFLHGAKDAIGEHPAG